MFNHKDSQTLAVKTKLSPQRQEMPASKQFKKGKSSNFDYYPVSRIVNGVLCEVCTILAED